MACPSTATSSSCTTKTACGSHVFQVHQYGLIRRLGAGRSVTSDTFHVGGYGWAIRLYPSGEVAGNKGHIVGYVVLVSPPCAHVSAICGVRLVDQVGGGRSNYILNCARTAPRPPWVSVGAKAAVKHAAKFFINKSKLEKPPARYLRRDDSLGIECIIAVKEPRLSETWSLPEIAAPPPSLSGDLGALLEEGDGADVTFHVRGETFPAHRAVLAARSPVFKTELRGPTRENVSGHVTIEDVQPAVFRAFIYFVYTDTLPAMDDLEGDDATEMLRHLVVMADRYAVHRLKRVCESLLAENLDARTARTTLALAIQHHCDDLKEMCGRVLLSNTTSASDKVMILRRTIWGTKGRHIDEQTKVL